MVSCLWLYYYVLPGEADAMFNVQKRLAMKEPRKEGARPHKRPGHVHVVRDKEDVVQLPKQDLL